MNHFKDETLMKYQCILPFSGLVPLQKNPTLKYCSTEITKSYIKKIKIILKQKEFKHCLDQVSCTPGLIISRRNLILRYPMDWIGLTVGYWCFHRSRECSQAHTYPYKASAHWSRWLFLRTSPLEGYFFWSHLFCIG